MFSRKGRISKRVDYFFWTNVYDTQKIVTERKLVKSVSSAYRCWED
jgi:hypothetical protein